MGGGGGWGAEGGVKHPFGLKGQCCAFSKWHERIQSTREAQTAVRSSLVPHAVLLTHPRTMKCTLVVSQHRQKAVCKSRPGNLLSGTWCFWIVHECAYHVQAKDGFQFLCVNGRFSKIRSHIPYRSPNPALLLISTAEANPGGHDGQPVDPLSRIILGKPKA